MSRILKPGPRPFAAFGTMLGLLLLFPLYLGVTKGAWMEAGKVAAGFLCLCGLLCVLVARLRIVVTLDSIACRPAAAPEKAVHFRQILFSRVRALAEPDHPVSLEIFGDSGNRTEEGEVILQLILHVGLKAFRKEDVQWLLSLPELKIGESEGPNQVSGLAPGRGSS